MKCRVRFCAEDCMCWSAEEEGQTYYATYRRNGWWSVAAGDEVGAFNVCPEGLEPITTLYVSQKEY